MFLKFRFVKWVHFSIVFRKVSDGEGLSNYFFLKINKQPDSY